MIARKREPYTIVLNREADELGVEAAFLLANLRLLSRRFEKDEHGYFEVFGTYLTDQLGVSKPKFLRIRDKLIEAGKIDYIAGRNQNAKSRYKIVL